MTAIETPELHRLAGQIREEHARCETSARTMLEHAREVGRLLIEAKSKVQHGGWETWVADNCGFSLRTGQAYMRLARGLLDGKAQRAAPLSLREGLALLAEPEPGLPDADAEVLRAADEAFSEARVWCEQQRTHLADPDLTAAEACRIAKEACRVGNDVAEIRIRLERRAGQLLGALPW